MSTATFDPIKTYFPFHQEHRHDVLSSVAEPLAQLLEELGRVIGRLTDEQYAAKSVGVIPGSIGAHVRHCLDHVAALLSAVACGRIDYDHRERGTDVERLRDAARDEIALLDRQLRQWPDDVINRSLRLRVLLTRDGDALQTFTTVGRELAFVLSHTIHHNAIIGALVRSLGGQLPEHFGYAPASIANKRRQQQQ